MIAHEAPEVYESHALNPARESSFNDMAPCNRNYFVIYSWVSGKILRQRKRINSIRETTLKFSTDIRELVNYLDEKYDVVS